MLDPVARRVTVTVLFVVEPATVRIALPGVAPFVAICVRSTRFAPPLTIPTQVEYHAPPEFASIVRMPDLPAVNPERVNAVPDATLRAPPRSDSIAGLTDALITLERVVVPPVPFVPVT